VQKPGLEEAGRLASGDFPPFALLNMALTQMMRRPHSRKKFGTAESEPRFGTLTLALGIEGGTWGKQRG
jgi:hypothetical protein